MKSEFATAIWLAKFKTEKDLSDYLTWIYPPGAEEPVCMFATDIGFDSFDEDFLESTHVESHNDLNTVLDAISFSEHFKDELLLQLEDVENIDEFNSIIALSAVRNAKGGDNVELFDYEPQEGSNKPYLQFVGVFDFELED